MRRILIVDDEPDMLDFLERVLRSGFEVLRAANATEALEILGRESVDAILTDQKMPRMSGLELLEQTREMGLDVVRVILSGYADVLDVERAVAQCGLHHYAMKPIDSQRLRAVLEQAFENKAAGRTIAVEGLG